MSMRLGCAAAAAAAVAAVNSYSNGASLLNITDISSHDALWRSQCSNVQEVYVVKHGDTPKQLMDNTYPGLSWEPMWALVALCNSQTAAAFNPGQGGTAQLPEGLTLNLPVFQLPGTASLHSAAVQQQHQQHNTAVRAADSRGTSANSQAQAGPTTGSWSEASSSGTSSSSSSSGPATTAWSSSPACGCGGQISITQPSSWLQAAQQAYSDTSYLHITGLLLSWCNPDANLTANMLLQPGQHLVGICAETATLATAAAAAAQLSTANSSVGSTVLPTGGTTAGIAAAAAAAATARQRRQAAAVPLAQASQQGPFCAVTTVSGHGSYVRQVAVQPSADCVWYADGCSGPTQGLQYQDVLTPCCNAHDFCYLCSYKLGWSGRDGRQSCDHLMLSNMLRACAGSFQIGGWWDWKAKWHKFWCDSTANVMFAAVWAYQELKRGTVHQHMQCPGDYGSVLAASDFCFHT